MEGSVFFHSKEVAAAELFFQALDCFDGVLVSGVEALRSSCVGYLKALIVVCIQGVQGVSIVANDIEKVRHLVGRKKKFFVEDILQQAHSTLQILILLLGNNVAVNHITVTHVFFQN